MVRILWLDNDIAQTTPYVAALERHGFEVTVVKTITECEQQLETDTLESHHDLVIFDVMVPTKNLNEEERYPPDITQRGISTGLAVWSRWSNRLRQNGTKTLVLTVRLDQALKNRFLSAGLPKKSFATKLDLRETDTFIERV